jgi:hypothetical protein
MLLFVWLRRRRRMVVKRHRSLQLPFHRFPFVLSQFSVNEDKPLFYFSVPFTLLLHTTQLSIFKLIELKILVGHSDTHLYWQFYFIFDNIYIGIYFFNPYIHKDFIVHVIFVLYK